MTSSVQIVESVRTRVTTLAVVVGTTRPSPYACARVLNMVVVVVVVVVVAVVVVVLSSLARIWRESSTIHSPPVHFSSSF